MFHESTLHTAFEIFDLVITASFRDQLMFYNAIRILFCLCITLVKMIQREGTTIWCFGHYKLFMIDFENTKGKRPKEDNRAIYNWRWGFDYYFSNLNEWHKNQQFLVVNPQTQGVLPLQLSSNLPISSNNNSASSIHVLFSIFVLLVQTQSYVLIAFLQLYIFTTTSKISIEANSFWTVSLKNGRLDWKAKKIYLKSFTINLGTTLQSYSNMLKVIKKKL